MEQSGNESLNLVTVQSNLCHFFVKVGIVVESSLYLTKNADNNDLSRVIHIQIAGKSTQETFWTPSVSWKIPTEFLGGFRPCIVSPDRPHWKTYTSGFESLLSSDPVPLLVLDCELHERKYNPTEIVSNKFSPSILNGCCSGEMRKFTG